MDRTGVAIKVRRFAGKEQCGVDGFRKSFTRRESVHGHVTVGASKKRITTPIVEMSSFRVRNLPI